MLINGANSHPTSRFCRVELEPTTFLNMVSKSDLRFGAPSAIRFLLSDPPPFISTLQLLSSGREGVC